MTTIKRVKKRIASQSPQQQPVVATRLLSAVLTTYKTFSDENPRVEHVKVLLSEEPRKLVIIQSLLSFGNVFVVDQESSFNLKLHAIVPLSSNPLRDVGEIGCCNN